MLDTMSHTARAGLSLTMSGGGEPAVVRGEWGRRGSRKALVSLLSTLSLPGVHSIGLAVTSCEVLANLPSSSPKQK